MCARRRTLTRAIGLRRSCTSSRQGQRLQWRPFRATLPLVLLSLKNISLNLGRTALLDKANLTLEPGERLCLMGRNGAGKSTLLKVIAGEQKPDAGEIITASQGLKVAQLPQDVPKDLAGTVYDVVADGLGEVGH